ncbi:MAG: GNAT family N-acetyltransferase [Caldilineaceae bacterium]
MFELLPENRTAIHPLFADYPYLQGLVYGALSGAFGQAFADQPESATVGMICIHDFVLLAGDAATPTATAMLQSCAPGAWLIGQDATWHKRFGEQWAQLKQKDRFAFQAPTVWNRARLTGLMRNLPAGCTLMQIPEAAAARFAQLSPSLVDFDAQGQPTMAHSVGFGVEQEGQFVAGCAGAPAGGMLDFEIQTALAHRRRGLATAVAAAMILYCLDHELKPCWDAANEMSARLAEKLGFVGRTPYLAYQIL